MKVHVLSLFPDMFTGVFGASILKKAQEKGGLRIQFYQQYCWIYPVKEIAEQKQQSIKLDHPFVFQGRSFQLTVEKAAGSKAKKLVAVLPLKKKMDKEIENIDDVINLIEEIKEHNKGEL